MAGRVHPPGSDDFESTAVGWLLDVVPPDYRLHGVLRRYPVALAAMARYHSRACVEGAREGYRTARTELAGTLPPHAIDTVLAAYRKEGARLAATARAVGLVERALRGEVFTPKMSSSRRPNRRPWHPPDPAAATADSTGPHDGGGRQTAELRTRSTRRRAGREDSQPKAAATREAQAGARRRAQPKASGGRRDGAVHAPARGQLTDTAAGRPVGPQRRQPEDQRKFSRPGEERPGQNVRRWHQASRGWSARSAGSKRW